MLVAGVVLGVLLGPAVMQRAMPEQYDKLFVGSGDTGELDAAEEALNKFLTDADTRQAEIDKIIEAYKLVGSDEDSTAIARDEQLMALTNRFAEIEEGLRADLEAAAAVVLLRQQEHRAKLSGMATAMLLLIVLLFAAEAILSPQRDEIEGGRAVVPPALSRLVTVRYALAAGWLMLMLARPVWLQGIDLSFAAVLLVVVLVAGLVPLGKNDTKSTPDPFS